MLLLLLYKDVADANEPNKLRRLSTHALSSPPKVTYEAHKKVAVYFQKPPVLFGAAASGSRWDVRGKDGSVSPAEA